MAHSKRWAWVHLGWGVALACLVMASAAPAQTLRPPPPGGVTPPAPVTSPGPGYVPRELVVRFEPGTTAPERQSLNAAQNADVRRALLLPRAYLLRLPKDRDVRAAQRAYERNPNVQYAEPNYVGQLFATPNDPLFTNSPFRMWAMHNTGQDFGAGPGTPDADIDAPEAWDVTTGSAAVTVGIADTGIDYNHPDLAANIWSNPGESGSGKETNNIDDDGNGKIDDFRGWDFTENDNDPQDYESHGSHVAGIVGAVGNNGLGTPGVNWNVRIAPLRVCSPNPFVQCTIANLADAFAYAGQKGMKVVNGSFGTSYSQAVADAIANASNTLFVFAAGNGGADGVGDNNDTAPQYPCQYPSPNIICVAATDHNDNRAPFSNYGNTGVDLAAPGTNIISTWPDVVRLRDTFEAADFGTKWTTGGTNNTWNRFCVTGGCVMADSPAGNYANNTNSFSRTTTAVNTTNMSDCRAEFLINWNLANDGDTLFVEASTDGVNWNLPWNFTFGGASGAWQWMEGQGGGTLDNLPALYFRWRLGTGPAGVSDGVYVDDVIVRCRRNGYPVGSTGWQFASGTSMASPHVAGAAALAFAKVPEAPVAGVKNAILDGVDKKASLQGATGVASGGRLNVNNMLARLMCCHVRPAGASPFRIPFVLAYNQCSAPNRTHGPPLAHPSCTPPVQRSSYLTVGTPDANGAGASSVGLLRLRTIVGNPGTPADESDVALTASITDVRQKVSGLPDYGGSLLARMVLRVTDRGSGPPAGTAATVQDVAFNVPLPCTPTGSTTIGSTCSISTTTESLVPGFPAEGAREVWQLSQIDLLDGGPDGNPFSDPNTVFAIQGIFVP